MEKSLWSDSISEHLRRAVKKEHDYFPLSLDQMESIAKSEEDSKGERRPQRHNPIRYAQNFSMGRQRTQGGKDNIYHNLCNSNLERYTFSTNSSTEKVLCFKCKIMKARITSGAMLKRQNISSDSSMTACEKPINRD
eukprot:SAG11_NODE_1270_length_5341_cov_3.290347_2_plen_137_part_00